MLAIDVFTLEVGWRLFGLAFFAICVVGHVYAERAKARKQPPPPTPIRGDDEAFVRRPGSPRG